MRLLAAVVLALSVAACVDSRDRGGAFIPPRDAGACEDRDKDGFGEGCTAGGDCNDLDPAVHTGCAQCATPQDGCACEDAAKPVSCFRAPTSSDDGTVMCHEGTRYCRAGKWSACESIVSYPRPDSLDTQAVVDPTGSPQRCNDCSVNCFVVRDNLDPVDAGLDATSTNISSPSGGGLTLVYTLPDAGPKPDAGTFDPSKCILNTAPDHDCDGIPSIYDPYPNMKPFATANPALFLDVAPGETGTGIVDLTFYLNSADVYFLIDQTGSMAGERDQLKANLVTGDFINDSSYQCADYDFDRVPNNELKNQGIIGAVRCKIRDANFGVGYFREIPLYYGDADSVTFRNLQDVTSNINSVVTAVNTLTTVSNNDWPEAAMLALNALVTGNGYYFGTNKTGLAPRIGCPSLTYGYPCFRNSAIPIVVMFTDAQFHNGPSNNNYAYSSSNLGITRGTTTSHTAVSATNETYASAFDLGDLTSSFNSYIGSTSAMAADFGTAAVSCGADGLAPDAMFKFTLSSAKTLRATTEGSEFDTTLTLFRGVPSTVTSLPAYPNTNDTGATAYGFGDVANKYVQASGSSTSLVADYSPNDVSCSAAPGSKDATFTFNLSQATRVALDTSGSGYTTSVALFSGTPVATTYTAVANTNNDFDTAYDVSYLNGFNKGFSGDTSAAGITATYTAAQLGCSSPPADAATDAVYSFTLSSATRVRLSTEDSSLKSVIALTNAGGSYVTPAVVPNTNELEASAYNIGALDGKAFQYTGSTASMTANYPGSLTGCGSGDTARDAVYKFTLAGTKTVDINTIGSSYDTEISLYRGAVNTGITTTAVGTNNFEIGTTAFNLGTVNRKNVVTSGATTNSMVADYNNTQIGCGSNSSTPDAVYKFHLDTATRVRMDTTGSSFDTVLSLHSSLPDVASTTLATNNNEAVASAYNVSPTSSAPNLSFDGTTNSMSSDVAVDNAVGCSANSSARDAVYKLNITSPGSYEISTVGSAFDTVLGLFPSTVYTPSPPTVSAQGTAGEQKSSAVSIGTMDGRWVSYSGNTSSMAANNSFNSCSANSSSKDVYYSFSLSSTRTVVIDTTGSGFDTVLALYTSADGYVDCNNDYGGNSTSQITATLNAGNYYVFIKGKSSGSAGAYTLTLRDTAISNVTTLQACDDNGGGGNVSKITATLSAGTYYAVVKGKLAADRGNYRLTVKALDLINSANRLTCNDDYSGNSSRIEQDLAAGDYYVVVKGGSNNAKGSYALAVSDVTEPSGYLTCNDDISSNNNSSQITQSLSAGTYFVVVKGWSSNSGAYTLNVKDTGFTPTTTYACDYNSGPGGTALLERDLTPGTYRVIVKGKTVSDKGAYKLILRDLGALPTQRLACDHNSGSGGASHVEADLSAGTYTVVLKGDTTAGGGNYKLSVRDATNIATSDTPVLCNNDGGSGSTSLISTSLSAGTYYALVKGYNTGAKGIYQLNIGAGSTSSGTFVPPTWSQTQMALNAKSVRVMSVLSCRDDPLHGDVQGDCVATKNQANALAIATGALGSSLQPLVFPIDGDGTGLSKTVVDGIGELAKYLEMNVTVRVVFEPDANPGFGVTLKAVDEAGDGCSGLIGNEHQRCAPGATPRFELAFNNPMNLPVPLNSKDPNGGYNFRAELIGDQQFVVDKVPIYIIPRDVDQTSQPVPKVTPSGSYWQTVSSPGCTGTQRPDWRDLTWNASVPNGTTLSFGVCASDRSADLTSCTPTPLCTITGGGPCTRDSDCTNGYCSADRNCQTITANSCTLDKECSLGSRCISGKCTFSGQPVYIGGVLGTANYTTSLRMNIGLTGNTSANTAPTVHDWALTYVCNQAI